MSILEDLRLRTTELDAASDALNARIHEIEEQIRASGASVRAQVQVEPGIELAWGRVLDGWGLLLCEAGQGDVQLTRAGRRHRINATGHVPQLVEELLKKTSEMLEQVKGAVP